MKYHIGEEVLFVSDKTIYDTNISDYGFELNTSYFIGDVHHWSDGGIAYELNNKYGKAINGYYIIECYLISLIDVRLDKINKLINNEQG